jgi:CMP-N-acetylneuraminic acid synthetase
LIPARGQSKRIPRKNIKLLGGVPLLKWTVDAAIKLPVREIIVSTEDEEIAAVAKSLGVRVLMRPKELASDIAKDDGVINHFLDNYPARRIIYLRPTTPFRDVDVMIQAINKVTPIPCCQLRSVQQMNESAYKCFDMGQYLEPIRHRGEDLTDSPNQKCPPTFAANGYIDIISFGMANEMKRIPFVTPPTIELDTPEQWAYAEYLIEKGLN